MRGATVDLQKGAIMILGSVLLGVTIAVVALVIGYLLGKRAKK